MELVKKIFTVIGFGVAVKTVYKIGETVGELKYAVKEIRAIRKDLHDNLENRD